MTQVLRRIEYGEGREGDVELLESLCTGIFGRCFCALGEAAVLALRGALKNFKEEGGRIPVMIAVGSQPRSSPRDQDCQPD